jgi:hypothetical protein
MRPGPKPVRLPASAAAELDRIADFFDAEAATWPKTDRRYGMKRWMEGMRRGLTDAAKSCRRRAARIRKAEQKALGDGLYDLLHKELFKKSAFQEMIARKFPNLKVSKMRRDRSA